MPPRNPGSLKRQKELARQQRQRDKKAVRVERKTAAKGKPRAAGGEDPDIAGIVPGPQPLPYDVEPTTPEVEGGDGEGAGGR